jgi:hypothetical protein
MAASRRVCGAERRFAVRFRLGAFSSSQSSTRWGTLRAGLTIRHLDQMPMTPKGKINKAELIALADPLVSA